MTPSEPLHDVFQQCLISRGQEWRVWRRRRPKNPLLITWGRRKACPIVRLSQEGVGTRRESLCVETTSDQVLLNISASAACVSTPEERTEEKIWNEEDDLFHSILGLRWNWEIPKFTEVVNNTGFASKGQNLLSGNTGLHCQYATTQTPVLKSSTFVYIYEKSSYSLLKEILLMYFLKTTLDARHCKHTFLPKHNHSSNCLLILRWSNSFTASSSYTH